MANDIGKLALIANERFGSSFEALSKEDQQSVIDQATAKGPVGDGKPLTKAQQKKVDGGPFTADEVATMSDQELKALAKIRASEAEDLK